MASAQLGRNSKRQAYGAAAGWPSRWRLRRWRGAARSRLAADASRAASSRSTCAPTSCWSSSSIARASPRSRTWPPMPTVSAIPEKARGIPITHGAAEDVLSYDPDLVLAGPFGVAATVDLLRRLGRRVVIVPLPQDLAGVRTAVRAVAAAVGAEREGRGADRRLRSAPGRAAPPSRTNACRPPSSTRSAARYRAPAAWRMRRSPRPGSATSRATIASTRGGQAAARGAGGRSARSPRAVERAPTSTARCWPTTFATRALRLLRRQHASIELPWRHWLCGTPHVVEAVERLAEARATASRRAVDDEPGRAAKRRGRRLPLLGVLGRRRPPGVPRFRSPSAPRASGSARAARPARIIFWEIRLPRALSGRARGRRARPGGRGAAGLSAQPAGRAEPGRRVGRRRAGRRAGDPSGPGGGAGRWRCRSAGYRAPQSPCWRWWRSPASTAAR